MNDQPILTLSDFPTPDSAARDASIRGYPVVLADGRSWLLPDYVPHHAEVWDQLYDDNLIAGRYQLTDVLLAGSRLLQANYDLPDHFAAWLLFKADPEVIVGAVETALFGRRDTLQSWSDWADSSLWSNGIDPATVPPAKLRNVLDQLVATGRAMQHTEFTSAGIAAGKRAALSAKFEAAGIMPTIAPAHQPQPEPQA